MSNVILQPCSNTASRINYENTIKNPIRLDDIKGFINLNQHTDLKEIYPDGRVQVWGVTPGKNKIKADGWQRICSGDVALFAQDKHYFSNAVITYKLHNAELAKYLWGVDKNTEQTWEYIYFLAKVESMNVEYADVSKVISYSENYNPQRFIVLNDDQSMKILDKFNLWSDIYYPEFDETSTKNLKAMLASEGSLDTAYIALRREEQAHLRRTLFNQRPNATCCICNKKYPTGLMVAAHIKKRSECTNEERLQFKNIAAPMCKFGCDELYERGYIGVSEGKVIVLKQENSTEATLKYLSDIENNECYAWNEDSKKYFLWHLDNNR